MAVIREEDVRRMSYNIASTLGIGSHGSTHGALGSDIVYAGQVERLDALPGGSTIGRLIYLNSDNHMYICVP